MKGVDCIMNTRRLHHRLSLPPQWFFLFSSSQRLLSYPNRQKTKFNITKCVDKSKPSASSFEVWNSFFNLLEMYVFFSTLQSVTLRITRKKGVSAIPDIKRDRVLFIYRDPLGAFHHIFLFLFHLFFSTQISKDEQMKM